MKVAETLRTSIIKCYYLDIRRLKRRLTFKGIDNLLAELELKLYNNLFIPGQKTDITQKEILETLYKIREIIIYEHNNLFLSMLDKVINKVHVFGLHFASLDIRQESSVHNNVLEAVAEKENLLPKNYKELTNDQKFFFFPTV